MRKNAKESAGGDAAAADDVNLEEGGAGMYGPDRTFPHLLITRRKTHSQGSEDDCQTSLGDSYHLF